MYPICVPPGSVIHVLAELDRQVGLDTQRRGCPRCCGPLHVANWTRKPRGVDIPEALAIRHGLCCGHCRKRTLPPSALFAGRRVYLKAVMLLVVAARQRDRERPTIRRLQRLFGMHVDTIRRWLRAFIDGLAVHPGWRAVRGRVSPTVRDSEVPGGLLDLLLQTSDANAALCTACRVVPAL